MIMNADSGFILICAALVFLMTPGLACFYGGLVRKKKYSQYNDDIDFYYRESVYVCGFCLIQPFICACFKRNHR